MINKTKLTGNRGFTLIETIIYIALSGLIIAGVLVSIYPILTGANQTSNKVITESESVFVLRKIAWAIGLGTTAISVSPTGDVLTISTSAGDIIIEEDNNMITVDGVPITASRVLMSDWSVLYTPKSGLTPGFIKVSFKADGDIVGPVRYDVHF